MAKGTFQRDKPSVKIGPIKGTWGGNCNRTACQQPGATWWNRSTRAYYCQTCARKLNAVNPMPDGEPLCKLSWDGKDA